MACVTLAALMSLIPAQLCRLKLLADMKECMLTQGAPQGMQGVALGMQEALNVGCRPAGGPEDQESGCSFTTSHVGVSTTHKEAVHTQSQVSNIQNVISKHINVAQQHHNTWSASVHAECQAFPAVCGKIARMCLICLSEREQKFFSMEVRIRAYGSGPGRGGNNASSSSETLARGRGSCSRAHHGHQSQLLLLQLPLACIN